MPLKKEPGSLSNRYTNVVAVVGHCSASSIRPSKYYEKNPTVPKKKKGKDPNSSNSKLPDTIFVLMNSNKGRAQVPGNLEIIRQFNQSHK